MTTVARYWVSILFVVIAFAVSGLLYGQLPDPVPTRWGLYGEIVGLMPKPIGAFFLPCLSLLSCALLIAAPNLAPRGFSMAPFHRVYPTIVAAITGFSLYMTVVALLASNAGMLDRSRVAAGAGVLLAVVGNYLGKVTRSFIGICTPWTLANDVVWERTHRFAGRVFVVGGVLIFWLALTSPGQSAASLTILAMTILAPIVYSYVVWLRLERT
jgi:immunity protein, SdpI family